MTAYYNEIDPFAAEWLRNLIADKQIAEGDVDERSITDVTPKDLKKYTQCHFFAGIGVWSYALKQAGWADDRPVWTGSCPCQPFSAAGSRKGFTDARHLWPDWYRLIRKCHPDTIFGEQVASKDGRNWLDLVSSDLEGADYAVGALCSVAAGFGAPHLRERLYFCGMGNTGERRQMERRGVTSERSSGGASAIDGVAHTAGKRLAWPMGSSIQERSRGLTHNGDMVTQHDKRAMAACHWLPFRDHAWRAVEPGTLPLVDGALGSMGQVCAYGNALCAPQAQGFIEAFIEVS